MHGGAGRNGGLDRLGSMFTQGPSMEVGKEGFRKGPAGGNGKAKAEGPGEPPGSGGHHWCARWSGRTRHARACETHMARREAGIHRSGLRRRVIGFRTDV